jgi:hypothetical protein
MNNVALANPQAFPGKRTAVAEIRRWAHKFCPCWFFNGDKHEG